MRSRILAVLAMLLLAGTSHGWAQETTGAVNGRVTDAQGLAVPGVTVTLTGPQGSKSAVTDADGRYNVPLLVPGTYTAKAELQGFKSVQQQNVIVRLGQAIEVQLKMEVGGVAETIEVTASSPTVDTRSTTVGAVLDSEMLKNVPVGRRFSDALYLAPGVTSSGSAGSANPSMGGGSGLDNQYVVDGVNITNTGYGALGSYSIMFGSLGNGTPYDFVKEVQVKTGGYEAEYGQAIGGVVNVVTKSGTNKLQGSGFGYIRPHGTEGDWKQFESPNGTVQTLGTDLSDVGVTLGGPIMKDKLFFFGAIDPSWETRTFQAPNNQDADGNYQFPLYTQGGIDRKREITSYSAKATYNLNSNNHFDASFFGDPAHGPNGPQRTSALLAQDTSQYSELTKYGGHNQTVSYNGVLSPKLVVEATYSHAKNNIVETPSNDSWNVTDFRVVPNVHDRRHRVLRAGQLGDQQPVLGEGDDDPRQPSAALRVPVRADRIRQHQPAHGPDVHRAERPGHGDGRADSNPSGDHRARSDLPRRARQLRRGAPDQAALRRLLRAGHLHGRRSADDPSGCALRAADAGRAGHQRVGDDRERPDAQRELGAAHRRDLRRAGQRPLEDLRQLGPLLREDPERPRRARAVGRRGHQPRRLLRRRPDAADS